MCFQTNKESSHKITDLATSFDERLLNFRLSFNKEAYRSIY